MAEFNGARSDSTDSSRPGSLASFSSTDASSEGSGSPMALAAERAGSPIKPEAKYAHDEHAAVHIDDEFVPRKAFNAKDARRAQDNVLELLQQKGATGEARLNVFKNRLTSALENYEASIAGHEKALDAASSKTIKWGQPWGFQEFQNVAMDHVLGQFTKSFAADGGSKPSAETMHHMAFADTLAQALVKSSIREQGSAYNRELQAHLDASKHSKAAKRWMVDMLNEAATKIAGGGAAYSVVA